MITIEYYTLDDEGNDVQVDQEFTITKEMIADLIKQHIALDKYIGEYVDENNLYIKRK